MIATATVPNFDLQDARVRVRRPAAACALRLFCALSITFFFATGAGAETIYRSEDARGNVTYSTTPPVNAVQSQAVPVAPGPTDAERRVAERLERKLGQAADRATTRVEARNLGSAARIAKAEQALKNARANLETAREQRESDWQGLAKGGRYLKAEYFDRVKAAEEALQQAEEALAKARRDAR